MPPPGYEPFLRAICANPADDAPRLVYADWLEENGAEERAEFIRVQIALSHQENDEELVEREQLLKQRNQAWWHFELPKLDGVVWHQFWRGFVNCVEFHDPDNLLKHVETVFAAAPINSLIVSGLQARSVARLAELELLQRVKLLTLREAHLLLPDDWSILGNSPHLQNLEWLTVTRTGNQYVDAPLTEASAEKLVTGPAFNNLKRLLVRGRLERGTEKLLRERFGKTAIFY